MIFKGHNVDIPQNWSKFLSVDDADAPILDQDLLNQEKDNIN